MKANRIYVDHGLLALRRRTSILDLTTVLTTTVTTVAVSATPPTRPFGAVLAWLLRLPAPGSASCRSGERYLASVVTGLSQLGMYTPVPAGTPRERRCRSTTFRGRTETLRTATSRTANPSAAPGRVIAPSTVTSRNTDAYPQHIGNRRNNAIEHR